MFLSFCALFRINWLEIGEGSAVLIHRSKKWEEDEGEESNLVQVVW